MRRFQLFEFGDQPWLPSWVRDAITEHLSRVFLSEDVAPLHAAVAEELAGMLRRSGDAGIVDLCSGAGGPLPAVVPRVEAQLGRTVKVTLTDRYPNRRETARSVGGDADGAAVVALDARSVPPELKGLRSVFNAIHHFRPDDVAAILRSATDGGRSVVVIEPFERLPRLAARLAAGGLRGGWRDARVYRGPRGRAAALHVILPVVLSWDGAVSVLRSYRPDELLAIAQGCGQGDAVQWRAARLTLPWGGCIRLTGEPSARDPAALRCP